MQRWVAICWAAICWALLALAGADECPDGGRCEEGQTCCSNPVDGYECCPFDQAECCGDHTHCCPAGTVCDAAGSGCLNATGAAVPWADRAAADQPGLSKSFRMIKSYRGEDDDNVCPDQSRCPAEFSCLRALRKFGCCPLAKGVPCSDGKHCCPEGHQCSAHSRSCIKNELVTTVLCPDHVSECPDGATCCENPDGKWECCPLPKAVCCEDKTHCCPEGSTCDVEHDKCISSSTKKATPMWAKLPARTRADWENQNEGEQVTAKTVAAGCTEKSPEVTTVKTVPPTEQEVSAATKAPEASDVPCDDKVACQDGFTCCKNDVGSWNCCPLPEAVCCDDLTHCCPKDTTCNLPAQTCDGDQRSMPWVAKVPTIRRQGAQEGNVTCDPTHACADDTTCCKTKTGDWACCPFPQAVCCDDHEHCCPAGTTCDLAKLSCDSAAGSTFMQPKTPAFSTVQPTTADTATRPPPPMSTEQTPSPNEDIQCDGQTSCPQSTTCCFMTSSQQWGCCPLPQAVCCADGNHCCPTHYRCIEGQATCTKGEVVIPWYTKLPASTRTRAEPDAVQCDEGNQCPDHTTCCQLATGEWGCCPLEHAVCCPDKEHCCPQGYTCNIASNSCQKLIMLQLESIPLTPVFLPDHRPALTPPKHGDVPCDDKTSCPDGDTCCKTSATAWGCCPSPNAVCCSDMMHCCPTGYTCTDTGGCTQSSRLQWPKWHVFLGDKKRALNV